MKNPTRIVTKVGAWIVVILVLQMLVAIVGDGCAPGPGDYDIPLDECCENSMSGDHVEDCKFFGLPVGPTHSMPGIPPGVADKLKPGTIITNFHGTRTEAIFQAYNEGLSISPMERSSDIVMERQVFVASPYWVRLDSTGERYLPPVYMFPDSAATGFAGSPEPGMWNSPDGWGWFEVWTFPDSTMLLGFRIAKNDKMRLPWWPKWSPSYSPLPEP